MAGGAGEGGTGGGATGVGRGLASVTMLLNALRGISATERSRMTGLAAFFGVCASAAGLAAALASGGSAVLPLSEVAEALLPAAGTGGFA